MLVTARDPAKPRAKCSKIQARIITSAFITVFSTSAFSDHNTHSSHSTYETDRARYSDFAKVISAHPTYQTREQRVPSRECWTETVRYERPSHRNEHKGHTGSVVGGLLGAAVGHSVGRGKSNRQLGAVAGAILGASIGHDVSRKHQQNHTNSSHSPEYREEERCEVREKVDYIKEVSGYDVTYRYHGRTYQTHTRHHPGKKIRVSVNVEPGY